MNFWVGLILISTSIAWGEAPKPALPPPVPVPAKMPSSYTPLLFPTHKNNIKVLPQRFEYLLLDAEKIKLGDILIDSSKLNFQLIFQGQDEVRLKFLWPAGLLLEGDIIIFNNYGKALWSKKLMPKEAHVESATSTEHPGLRNELATYESEDLEMTLVDEMKYLPFMKYCISHFTNNTRIQLCSRELYITTTKEGAIIVKQREANKSKAEIYINNQMVDGDQGLIFLNDPKENILFKLISQSGAVLEIETRMKEVDFKDAVLSADGQKMILTSEGAEPVQKKDVEVVNETTRRIRLPLSDSILYLKGEGGIPMRQEFYLKGKVPLEAFRPYATSQIPTRTYSSSIDFNVRPAKNTRISSKEKNSTVTAQGSTLKWELKDLVRGQMNKRYINVQTTQGEFVASHQVLRGFPFQATLGVQYDTSGRLKQKLGLDWWFENFLFIPSSFTRFRWGLQIDQTLGSSTNKAFASTYYNRYSLAYRLTPGFNFTEPTWGLRLNQLAAVTKTKAPATETTAEISSQENYSTLGYGLFMKRPTDWSWMSWYLLSLDFYNSAKRIPAFEGDVELYKSGMELWMEGTAKFGSVHYLGYGLGYSTFPLEIDPDTALAKANISLKLNYSYCF